MTFRDRIVVREIDGRALLCGRRRFRALVLQNHPKSIRLFQHSKNNYSQRVYDKSDIMFVAKNIVRTSMREDVFGTFAQMKHSLFRRSCLALIS
jgi:hypothetical protein